MKVEISDWVQAKTKNGELIHGFVDAVNELQGMANVIVVKSDNEESVGKPVAVREQWLRKLPVNALDDAEQIHSLIDLALSTRDEQWFNELTEKLKAFQQKTQKGANNPVAYPSSANRLGYQAWNSERNRA